MFRPLRTVLATSALVAGVLVSTVGTPSYADSAAPRGEAPTVVGHACASGVGVTVVVDFTAFANDVIRLGCAPGAQPNGFAALTAAGFTFAEGSTAGFLCTINNYPRSGAPFCEASHYWSYSKSDGSVPWHYSHVGGATQHRINIDAVEGWRFVSFTDTDTAPGLAVDGIAPYRDALADAKIRTNRDPNRVTTADRVKLAVTVKGGFGIFATGGVSISEKGSGEATGTNLVDGSATFRLGKLKAGEHTFRIEYAGDDIVKAGKLIITFKVFAA